MQAGRSIDVHCHHFAFTPKNGGYVHPKFYQSARIRWYLNAIGVLNWQEAFLRRLPETERIDVCYKERLIQQIESSSLDHAVILALDGVYDERGFLDYHRTPKYISNDAVSSLCKESPKMLFGASVNPYRRDWKDELDRSIESGAVLIKWLPGVMGFDPSDERCLPFYELLRKHGIPVLIHIGFEYAVPSVNKHYSDLDRLLAPLNAGVKVIAAHCCGGRPIFDSKSMFEDMKRLLQLFPGLYLDVAAMASFHRKSRFLNALSDPIVRERLVFGTDYPIPVHPWAFRKELNASGRVLLPKNYPLKLEPLVCQQNMVNLLL